MVLIYYKKRPFCIYTFDNWREELLHRHQKAIWTSVPSGLSENFFTLPLSLKSSTMTISCRNCLGDISMTLCTVLIRVDQPSLWKTNMTLAEGRSSGYCQYLHLLVNQSEVKGHRKKARSKSYIVYTEKLSQRLKWQGIGMQPYSSSLVSGMVLFMVILSLLIILKPNSLMDLSALDLSSIPVYTGWPFSPKK